MKHRILFCSDVRLNKKLGAAKVVVEVAECMAQQGWDCRLAGPEEICPGLERLSGIARLDAFCNGQRAFLQQQASDYDVVDYGHQYLPYSRRDFAPGTLFVARSVLLTHHLACIRMPKRLGWRARVKTMLRGRAEAHYIARAIHDATRTVQAADLVNVSNTDDQKELVRHGIDPGKTVVLPFGISPTLRPLFDAISSEVPAQAVVAFVGTFDYRKGAAEFPQLFTSITAAVPGVRFKLLGTKGLFSTAREVLAHFPPTLAKRIEVVPEYPPDALPELLAPCSAGVFPSHVEGFGFGVLEMLAASLPVIAYNVPGPPMMLPGEYLVPRGDVRGMSHKIATLLLDRSKLHAARQWAQQQSRQFDWRLIAMATSRIYLEHLAHRQPQ